MLWRALQTETPGHYIDIGAGDPDELSVSKAFYQRGWTGINIEPAPVPFQRLELSRPKDINLPVAAGAQAGRQPFYVVPDTGLSTLMPDVASYLLREGRASREIAADVMTLSSICENYWSIPTHFLKIDVEGAEAQVLEGADFAKWRPWIVLVEATEPLSQIASHSAWEPTLLANAYRYVYFDGLNRFYVAVEHYARLGPFFRWPPCVFDDFILDREQELMEDRNRLELDCKRTRKDFEDLLASRSWRLTAPLRDLKRGILRRAVMPRHEQDRHL